ncbi:MAG: undecaprenyl/decaprenyl-phosphate alpha-N-acetylglucosaminyl 1-phosphate transferase [Bacteroidota bacterium]|nr:undecaprenyl/decaprenyl-phosphate alpha-N-acetylglucosaminyl 1-phosphate transferase [Bacteroidota bacterium]
MNLELLILSFFTSFFIVLFSTPALIKVAIMKGLIGEPDEERKLHKRKTPSIGGIIIFAGAIFTYSLWFPGQSPHNLKYVVAGGLLLFFVGVKDDIIGTAPVKKLIAHVLVGLMLIMMADVRITSLYGLFGIREIPEWASVFLSLYAYIVVVNSINLIDGVDGLATGVGVISSFAFGIWFYLAGDIEMAMLAISLGGALFAFMFFNFSPARIFMGDSGSLTLGFIFSLLAIKMVEFKVAYLPTELMSVSKPILALSILAYPLIDTLRIFIYRSFRGISPFAADKNHIHHRLLDIGLSQKQTVLAIYLFSVFIIILAFMTQKLDATWAFVTVAGFALLIAQIPFFFKKVKNKASLVS